MADYYVNSSAGAGGDGSVGSPWDTLADAVAGVADGNHTINVTGTFTETLEDYGNGTGTGYRHWLANGTVVITGRVFIHGNLTKFDGFTVSGLNTTADWNGAIWTGGTSNVITNCIVNDMTQIGIVLSSASSGCTVSNCTIYDVIQDAIAANGTNNTILNNDVSRIKDSKYGEALNEANAFEFGGTGHVFRGNYVHDIYFADITTLGGAHFDVFQTSGGSTGNITIERNRAFVGNPATNTLELVTDPDSTSFFHTFMIEGVTGSWVDGLVIRNNILECATGGYHTGGSGYVKNVEIYNNVFKGSLSQGNAGPTWPTGIQINNHQTVKVYNNIVENFMYCCLAAESSTGIDMNYNLCTMSDSSTPAGGFRQGTGTSGAGDIANNTNPLFVSFADSGGSLNNYNLQSGSPCKDKGVTIAGVTDDYAGTARPQGTEYDIGAYEYGDSVAPVITTAWPPSVIAGDGHPTSINIRFITDENATCKYTRIGASVSYDDMEGTFTTTGGTTHSKILTFGCGQSYNVWARGVDIYGNKSTVSTLLSFTIPPIFRKHWDVRIQ